MSEIDFLAGVGRDPDWPRHLDRAGAPLPSRGPNWGCGAWRRRLMHVGYVPIFGRRMLNHAFALSVEHLRWNGPPLGGRGSITIQRG